MANKKSKVFHYLRKSHRSTGIFLSVFLIMLSVTGVVLNHTDELALAKKFVPSFIAARYYPGGQSAFGYLVEEQYFYSLKGRLYVDKEDITHCSELKGVIQHKQQQVILCVDDVLILTMKNQLIERLDSSLGLPLGIQGISTFENQLVINTSLKNYLFNPETLELEEGLNSSMKLQAKTELPTDLVLGSSISWQQFFLDIHSGIFLGHFGKWFMDFVALCLCGMAVSGIAMWFKKF